MPEVGEAIPASESDGNWADVTVQLAALVTFQKRCVGEPNRTSAGRAVRWPLIVMPAPEDVRAPLPPLPAAPASSGVVINPANPSGGTRQVELPVEQKKGGLQVVIELLLQVLSTAITVCPAHS